MEINKFRYVFQNQNDDCKYEYFTLQDIEKTNLYYIKQKYYEKGYKLVGRDQYTNFKDTSDKEIYERDELAIRDYIIEPITDDGRGPRAHFNHMTQVYCSNGQWLVDIKEDGYIVPACTLTLYRVIFDLVGRDYVEIIGDEYQDPRI